MFFPKKDFELFCFFSFTDKSSLRPIFTLHSLLLIKVGLQIIVNNQNTAIIRSLINATRRYGDLIPHCSIAVGSSSILRDEGIRPKVFRTEGDECLIITCTVCHTCLMKAFHFASQI